MNERTLLSKLFINKYISISVPIKLNQKSLDVKLSFLFL